MEPPNQPADWVDLTFLGGLGEIGLNSLVALETADTLVMVDAGLMFPEDHMLGIDIVIPDFSYVRERRDKVAALILTHGHEDHIGAVPFLLKELSLPVVGTPFTLALVKEKLKEHGLLDQADLREIRPRETMVLGSLTFEFIAVSHSIVDGVGLAVHTPQGILVHSGDFKMDQTPVIGPATDLNRFAAYGEAGVLALMSDSTNAERPGFTLSERQIGLTLEELIKEAPGRVIVAVFASHISRLQQIVSLAAKYGRKVLFNGKSMVVNSRLAKELGYLTVEADLEITVGDLERLPPEQTIIVTTGSQGEPLSALARIALEAHKHVHIQKGDLVILSSKFIPGNERAITTVINNLCRLGAEVVYEQVAAIHSSGHACQEELKLLLSLTRPRHFIPIHGEMRHLIGHAKLARSLGLAEPHIMLGHRRRPGALRCRGGTPSRTGGGGAGLRGRQGCGGRLPHSAQGPPPSVQRRPGHRHRGRGPPGPQNGHRARSGHPGVRPGGRAGASPGPGPENLRGHRGQKPHRTHPGLAGDSGPGGQSPAQALLQGPGTPAHDPAPDPDPVMKALHPEVLHND